jgi:hypothetical protein
MIKMQHAEIIDAFLPDAMRPIFFTRKFKTINTRPRLGDALRAVRYLSRAWHRVSVIALTDL